MAFNIDSISTRAVHKPPTMIVVGKPKLGKTCFCAGDRVENGEIVEWGINCPIILWMKGEQGCNDIPVAKNRDALGSFDELMDAICYLAQNDHEYQTVTVDSLTTLVEIVKAKVQTEYPEFADENKFNQYGKGNAIAAKFHRQIADALTWLRDNKGMSAIVTAHIKHNPKDVADPEKGVYSAWMADIPDAIWNIYERSFDVVAYADTCDIVSQQDIGMGNKQGKVTSTNNGQRFLFFRKTLSHPSGGRGIYGHLPDRIPFDWASFQNAVAETVAKLNKNNK